jgi:hypothetical protein
MEGQTDSILQPPPRTTLNSLVPGLTAVWMLNYSVSGTYTWIYQPALGKRPGGLPPPKATQQERANLLAGNTV